MATNDELMGGKIQASVLMAADNYRTAKSLLESRSQTRDAWALACGEIAASLAVADEVRALRYTILELAGVMSGVR